MKINDSKPRVRFCWECGKKLYGNHHVEVVRKEDKLPRVLHKQCFKKTKDEYLPLWTSDARRDLTVDPRACVAYHDNNEIDELCGLVPKEE